ncbi:unnamed protein product [Penicillium egyptiacum]|uniref:Uncharacterized protein n=1 Tax=Penicillium egyptiacum TaxID=1303716 RepID=A0A9W4K5H4_9EURO|nr:unnamed protein product [Penicillium egyptiacum]
MSKSPASDGLSAPETRPGTTTTSFCFSSPLTPGPAMSTFASEQTISNTMKGRVGNGDKEGRCPEGTRLCCIEK